VTVTAVLRDALVGDLHKLDPPAAGGDNRRVLAFLRHLNASR
jgi:hypothetical protein